MGKNKTEKTQYQPFFEAKILRYIGRASDFETSCQAYN